MILKSINEKKRSEWLKQVLGSIKQGNRILDAGAGEQQNKKYCKHLNYVSQDFGQYKGMEVGRDSDGLHIESWDTSRIDIISDITEIPEPDASFDAILCSEVLEHIPDPTIALDEFARLLKQGGTLVLTAPFSSNVHMAPYFYSTGFSKFWYEYHLKKRGFKIESLLPNGDWFTFLEQEITRLGGLERLLGNWIWPFAYAFSLIGILYFKLRSNKKADDIACFGWHCLAVKE